MKNLKIVLLILVTISLSTWSCKKDPKGDTTDPNPTNQTCYFTKVDYGDSYMTATYNSTHQLTKIQEYDSLGNADSYYTTFTYANGKITIIEGIDNGTVSDKFEFYYGANTTPDSLIMYSDNGGTMERQAAYALTFSGNQLVKAELIISYMGFDIVYQKSEFTYTNGNMTMEKNYEFDFTTLSMALTGSSEYSYDNKKNPYYGIGLDYLVFFDSGIFGSQNNAISYTDKDDTGTIDQSNSTTSTIEYNTNNYPTKITKTSLDNSSTDVETYTYDCSVTAK